MKDRIYSTSAKLFSVWKWAFWKVWQKLAPRLSNAVKDFAQTAAVLKSSCETCQSDGQRHFPHPAADTDKTTPTHRKRKKGWYVCRIPSGCDPPDRAVVLGEIVTTSHSVYIADLNWGNSHVSSCRSFLNFSVEVFFLNFSVQAVFKIHPSRLFLNSFAQVLFKFFVQVVFQDSGQAALRVDECCTKVNFISKQKYLSPQQNIQHLVDKYSIIGQHLDTLNSDMMLV